MYVVVCVYVNCGCRPAVQANWESYWQCRHWRLSQRCRRQAKNAASGCWAMLAARCPASATALGRASALLARSAACDAQSSAIAAIAPSGIWTLDELGSWQQSIADILSDHQLWLSYSSKLRISCSLACTTIPSAYRQTPDGFPAACAGCLRCCLSVPTDPAFGSIGQLFSSRQFE